VAAGPRALFSSTCPAMLTLEALTPEQAQAQALDSHRKGIADRARWLAHYDNRLTYERPFWQRVGTTPPPKPKTKADLPLLNYSGKVPIAIGSATRLSSARQTPITKAELAKISNDYRAQGRLSVWNSPFAYRHARPIRPRPWLSHHLSDGFQAAPRPDAATVAAQAEADEACKGSHAGQETDEARERTLAT